MRTIIGQSDAANIGHWEINGEDGSLYWSDEVYRIHGLQPGGKIDVEAAIAAYHPDDRELVAEFVRKAVEDHQDYQFDLRIIRPNGEIRDVQSTGVVRLNSDKSLHTVFGVFQDATKIRRKERALVEQTAVLQQAERIGKFGHWALYPKTNHLYWSDEVYRIHGQPTGSEIDLAAAIAAYHPEDRAQVTAYVEGAVERQQDYAFELRLIRTDGVAVYVTSTGRVETDDQGRTERVVGIFQDVTETRRVELALRRSEENFRNLVTQAGDGVFVADLASAKLVQVNNQAMLSLGYTEAELLTMTVPDIDPDVGLEKFRTFTESLKAGETATVKSRQRRKDGSRLPVELRMGLTKFASRDMLIMLAQDITEQQETQRQLTVAKEQAELTSQAKSSFLANMSHELRTPLNAINGFSQMLQQQVFGPLGDERYREYAAYILSSGEHLLTLITDILDISKIEAGEMQLREENIDLADLIEDEMKIIRARGRDADIVIDVDLPDGLPFVRVDSRRIRQTLLNLVANALKFTPASGRITVATQVKAIEGVIISVKDTGVGIPAEFLKTILDPFIQVQDNSLTAGARGTGLGLSIVKSFVELHGGKVQINSIVDQGTEVLLNIPPSRLVAEDS